ncbi:MAG: hypothetical protein WCX47_01280 [Bacilli bacterium]|jgi:hypothetical protein|nr:hypothetical protein [Bacilli bacterium]MDD3388957.1 hypothetical protein [Bacilli bacterium]MDD4344396.1 hypothetical protein [Bacilli bacterium]MDD4520700.1 hypothetical protein [Bacilli bacterium]MDY0399325.1 hypothetical protein [Bacilli bacterium]
MEKFVKWMDSQSLLVKVIFAIPLLDILWVAYRLVKSLVKKSVLGIVLAILLIVIGLPWLWLVDIITLIVAGKVIWVD